MLKDGSIIKSSNWPEPVEIKLIEEKENYCHTIGLTNKSDN